MIAALCAHKFLKRNLAAAIVAFEIISFRHSGPERIRTADLYIANVALYQLSYGPVGLGGRSMKFASSRVCLHLQPTFLLGKNVGVEGIEPSTSSLSEKRSSH